MKQKPIVRFLPLLVFFSLILGIISLASSLTSTIKRQNAKEEREMVLIELQKRESELQKKLEIAKSPEFIESEARKKLNMARPGETIILINQSEKGSSIQEIYKETSNWKQWLSVFF